jgi:hypothetical protein
MTIIPVSKSEFATPLLVVPIMLGLVLLFSLIYARRVKTRSMSHEG